MFGRWMWKRVKEGCDDRRKNASGRALCIVVVVTEVTSCWVNACPSLFIPFELHHALVMHFKREEWCWRSFSLFLVSCILSYVVIPFAFFFASLSCQSLLPDDLFCLRMKHYCCLWCLLLWVLLSVSSFKSRRLPNFSFIPVLTDSLFTWILLCIKNCFALLPLFLSASLVLWCEVKLFWPSLLSDADIKKRKEEKERRGRREDGEQQTSREEKGCRSKRLRGCIESNTVKTSYRVTSVSLVSLLFMKCQSFSSFFNSTPTWKRMKDREREIERETETRSNLSVFMSASSLIFIPSIPAVFLLKHLLVLCLIFSVKDMHLSFLSLTTCLLLLTIDMIFIWFFSLSSFEILSSDEIREKRGNSVCLHDAYLHEKAVKAPVREVEILSFVFYFLFSSSWSQRILHLQLYSCLLYSWCQKSI